MPDPTPVAVARRLARAVAPLRFAAPVATVYHPLDYAWPATRQYLERHARPGAEVLLVGMNPGPWGMAQTGVPFGEVAHVRGFLGIDATVGKPEREHPKRPVLGLDCPRSEVSGRRLWGWAAARFGTAEAFFRRFFVWNWCPLAFMEESGRNRTPDKLAPEERAALEPLCDAALAAMVRAVRPRIVIGVGAFAERRARIALAEPIERGAVALGSILHPSPASPAANRGWSVQAERQLRELGVDLPGDPVVSEGSRRAARAARR